MSEISYQEMLSLIIPIQPLKRLIKREKFNLNISKLNNYPKNFDLFLLYDSINKRGGLKNVIENNRWKEIRFENYFENYKDLTEQNLEQIYVQNLSDLEQDIDEEIFKDYKVQIYIMPLIYGFDGTLLNEVITQQENKFIQECEIQFNDLYLCLRNLIITNENQLRNAQQVPKCFQKQFLQILKFLIQNQIVNIEKQDTQILKILNFQHFNQKIAVIGGGPSCYNLCLNLSKLGMKVYQNILSDLDCENLLFNYLDTYHPIDNLKEIVDLQTIQIDTIIYDQSFNKIKIEKNNVDRIINQLKPILNETPQIILNKIQRDESLSEIDKITAKLILFVNNFQQLDRQTEKNKLMYCQKWNHNKIINNLQREKIEILKFNINTLNILDNDQNVQITTKQGIKNFDYLIYSDCQSIQNYICQQKNQTLEKIFQNQQNIKNIKIQNNQCFLVFLKTNLWMLSQKIAQILLDTDLVSLINIGFNNDFKCFQIYVKYRNEVPQQEFKRFIVNILSNILNQKVIDVQKSIKDVIQIYNPFFMCQNENIQQFLHPKQRIYFNIPFINENNQKDKLEIYQQNIQSISRSILYSHNDFKSLSKDYFELINNNDFKIKTKKNLIHEDKKHEEKKVTHEKNLSEEFKIGKITIQTQTSKSPQKISLLNQQIQTIDIKQKAKIIQTEDLQNQMKSVNIQTEITQFDLNSEETVFHMFGIQHDIVRQHNSIVQELNQQLPYHKIWKKFKFFYNNFRQINTVPQIIANNLKILNFGSPYMDQNELKFNNNFVSIRKDKSFLNKGLIVKYIQFIMYIEQNNKLFYGLIPEDNSNIVLFHTNPNYLYEFVVNKITIVQKNVKQFQDYFSLDNNFQNQILYPYIAEKIIEQPNIHLNKQIQGNFFKEQQNYDIYSFINNFLQKQLKLYDLNEINFGELIFGIKNNNLTYIMDYLKKNDIDLTQQKEKYSTLLNISQNCYLENYYTKNDNITIILKRKIIDLVNLNFQKEYTLQINILNDNYTYILEDETYFCNKDPQSIFIQIFQNIQKNNQQYFNQVKGNLYNYFCNYIQNELYYISKQTKFSKILQKMHENDNETKNVQKKVEIDENYKPTFQNCKIENINGKYIIHCYEI